MNKYKPKRYEIWRVDPTFISIGYMYNTKQREKMKFCCKLRLKKLSYLMAKKLLRYKILQQLPYKYIKANVYPSDPLQTNT